MQFFDFPNLSLIASFLSVLGSALNFFKFQWASKDKINYIRDLESYIKSINCIYILECTHLLSYYDLKKTNNSKTMCDVVPTFIVHNMLWFLSFSCSILNFLILSLYLTFEKVF